MKDTKKLVCKMYEITKALKQLHEHRNFTPDGILVGSLGEVLAEYHYGLKPLPPATPLHDCKKGKKLIQIKTTQRESIQIGDNCDYLLALKLNEDGTVEEWYNGPGQRVWDRVKDKKRPKNGLYSVRLNVLRKMMENVPVKQRLKREKP